MAYDKQLKALADANRRSIFERLCDGATYTHVLSKEQAMSQPATSQHLKFLLEAGLVKSSGEGRRTLYSACTEALSDVRNYLVALQQRQSSKEQNHKQNTMISDHITEASKRWGQKWPGMNPDVYSVTMRLLLMGRDVERALKEVATKNGLLGSELLLLDVLSLSHEQTATASELQERLGISKGAITKLMQSLEGVGFISRTLSEVDRRVSYVCLTSKAHAMLRGILERQEYGADYEAAQHLPADKLKELAGLLQHYHGIMRRELVRRESQKSQTAFVKN